MCVIIGNLISNIVTKLYHNFDFKSKKFTVIFLYYAVRLVVAIFLEGFQTMLCVLLRVFYFFGHITEFVKEKQKALNCPATNLMKHTHILSE